MHYIVYVEQKELVMNDTKNILKEHRKQQVFDIVDVYTNRFTAALFCDNQCDVDRYTREATIWLLIRVKDMHLFWVMR